MSTDANILFWDIETTALDAGVGSVVCAAFKSNQEKKPRLLTIADYRGWTKEPWDDSKLVRDIAKEIAKADIIVGHYSTRFDLPFVNSRLLKSGQPPCAPVPHVDTWRVSRNRLKLGSNRLAALSAFFGLEQKTPLSAEILQKMRAYDTDTLDLIYEHCVQDVIVLEQAYERIKIIAPDHPNVNLARAIDYANPQCPVCGSFHVQKRGKIIAKARVSQRYQCNDCGHWGRGLPKKVMNVGMR